MTSRKFSRPRERLDPSRLPTLGARVHQLRQEKKISLRELARQLEVSHVFVRDIETGKRYPSEAVMSRVSYILGISTEELGRLDPRIKSEQLAKLAEKDMPLALELKGLIAEVISGHVSVAQIRGWRLAIAKNA